MARRDKPQESPMTEPEPDTADAPWRHILADTPDALIFADKGGLIRA